MIGRYITQRLRMTNSETASRLRAIGANFEGDSDRDLPPPHLKMSEGEYFQHFDSGDTQDLIHYGRIFVPGIDEVVPLCKSKFVDNVRQQGLERIDMWLAAHPEPESEKIVEKSRLN